MLKEIRNELENMTGRSAWSRGVTVYAGMILDEIDERASYEGHEPRTREEFIDYALNGARDWRKRETDLYAHWNVASWGGSYLIYNGDIADTLCTPSELKRTRNGERRPNSREDWLDVQARALFQACNLLLNIRSEVLTALNAPAIISADLPEGKTETGAA